MAQNKLIFNKHSVQFAYLQTILPKVSLSVSLSLNNKETPLTTFSLKFDIAECALNWVNCLNEASMHYFAHALAVGCAFYSVNKCISNAQFACEIQICNWLFTNPDWLVLNWKKVTTTPSTTTTTKLAMDGMVLIRCVRCAQKHKNWVNNSLCVCSRWWRCGRNTKAAYNNSTSSGSGNGSNEHQKN